MTGYTDISTRRTRSPGADLPKLPYRRRYAHFDGQAKIDREENLAAKLAMMANAPKLLVELFPELAAELEQLLSHQGESELARQVSKLPVIERCRCGDDFCGMFYVLPKPKGAYGPGHRNVSLEPKQGMLILDVLAERIAAVEVLYRDAIRQRLIIEFP